MLKIEVGEEMIIVTNCRLYARPEGDEEWTMRTGRINRLAVSMRLKNYSKWGLST